MTIMHDFQQDPDQEGRGGRSSGNGNRLRDHRLDELDADVKKLLEKADMLTKDITEIKTGMITKTQLFLTVLALLGTVVAHLIIKSLN